MLAGPQVERSGGDLVHQRIGEPEPGAIDGFALAARAREERPDIQVLYTSGFADSDKLPPELLAGEVELLPKPYRISDLGQRLERLLKQVARLVA